MRVFKRGAFEVGDDVGDSTLDKIDFVGNGSALSNGCGSLGLAVAVNVGCSRRRLSSGVLGVKALDFLFGFGDVLVKVST